MNKKILLSIMTIGLVAMLAGTGLMAYFSDTETSTNNVFTAGEIDLSIDPTGGQEVVTVEGFVDLKPCETGYTTTTITNVGPNPATIWKHVTNVDNREHGVTDAEGKYYTANPGSENWLISNWIHYDMIACKPIIQEYNTAGEDVEATVVKEWCCCTTTWTVDISSDNPAGHTYGVGLAVSLNGITPSFQVWYAEYLGPDADWLYQEFGTGWDGLVVPVSEVPGITATGVGSEKQFVINIDCEYLGGTGATYYWAMQLRTNLITWLGDYDWGESAEGFLENHVGTYSQLIEESEGFTLTGTAGVASNWIYLGTLNPDETMCVIQSYHLDETVDNWGQSDRVWFDIEYLAQQIGAPAPTPQLLP